MHANALNVNSVKKHSLPISVPYLTVSSFSDQYDRTDDLLGLPKKNKKKI